MPYQCGPLHWPKLKNIFEVVREQDAGKFIWTTAEEGTGGWRISSGK